MLFGNKIKELRNNKGLLQRQVASCLDIDTPLYSKYERGERLPKQEHICTLASLFNANERELRTLCLADKIIKSLKNDSDIKIDVINKVMLNLHNNTK